MKGFWLVTKVNCDEDMMDAPEAFILLVTEDTLQDLRDAYKALNALDAIMKERVLFFRTFANGVWTSNQDMVEKLETDTNDIKYLRYSEYAELKAIEDDEGIRGHAIDVWHNDVVWKCYNKWSYTDFESQSVSMKDLKLAMKEFGEEIPNE